MLGMDVETVVPGHGPVTDKQGIAGVRDYLSFVETESSERFVAGMDSFDAARELSRLIGASGSSFAAWSEAGRISVNVETVYRSLDPGHQSPDVVEQFRRMAALETG